jgi:hypothetical protein
VRTALSRWVSWKWLAPVLSVGLGFVLAYLIFAGRGAGEGALPAPDTPPPEYLYLDTRRVLAYLGQVSGGLSASEKHALAVTDTRTGKVTVGSSGEVGRTIQNEQRTEEVVTPTAADRFYRLLRFLRAGNSPTPDGSRPWIRDIDAALSDLNKAEDVRASIADLREGDFVRLQDVHLTLPSYAAIFPRTSYADSYLGGRIARPPQTLFAPTSARVKAAVSAYIKALGRNPVLPFIARTIGPLPSDQDQATFFIPGQYRALLSAPRVLLGKLTVVGKVVYRESRSAASCKDTPAGCVYSDRQTVALYGPALRRAGPAMLRNLGFTRETALAAVAGSMRLGAPVIVVVPLAIYD